MGRKGKGGSITATSDIRQMPDGVLIARENVVSQAAKALLRQPEIPQA